MARPRKGETPEEARDRREKERAEGPGPEALDEIAKKPKAKGPSRRELEGMLRQQRRVMAQAVAVPFQVIARRYGPKWELDQAEKDDLGAAVTECLIAYAPADMGRHFPLIYLGASLAGIISKRVSFPGEAVPEYAENPVFGGAN